MDTRKYGSPLGRDIGTSKATKGRGWKGLKGQMALALAVSLWIGGVGVAMAQVTEVKDGDDYSGDINKYVYGNHTAESIHTYDNDNNSENTVNVTGGKAGNVYGAYADTNSLNNNVVNITAGTAGYVYGAAINTNGNGDVYNNEVHLSGGYCTSIFGGRAGHGKKAQNNIVKITGGSVGSNGVYGGSSSGDAIGNKVEISGGEYQTKVTGGSGKNATQNTVEISEATITGDICGGNAKNGYATYNTVNFNNATIAGNVYGGKTSGVNSDVISGNILNLSGINTVNNVQNFASINITEAKWGSPNLTVSGSLSNGDGKPLPTISTEGVIIDVPLPWEKATGNSTNLIETTNGINANYTPVSDIKQGYVVNSTTVKNFVTGVEVDAAINGSIDFSADKKVLAYTITANQASKLTFGDVEWKDSGALINHATTLSTISFNGADVDTTNIKFKNIQELKANKQMTLVSDFGNSVGTITGTKYKVGNALEGEGSASLVDSDNDGTKDALIFTAKTGVGNDNGGDNPGGNDEPVLTAREKTHNAVMGAEVGMAALSAGNDFVGAATEGLSMAGNTGSDGLATYANMGGGSMKVETGSHVKTRSWNAILALGHKNEKKLSTTEYGAFFEYGRVNYTTFNGNERGDGSTHYTGGGILGKWKKNNGFYVEGSLRAGSIHDDATNVLRADDGTPYSYTTNSTYWGAHIGVGKEIKLNKTDLLDLYAKYFYNHRGSVSFDAGGDHYDLDAVESSVLRVGTRYTVKQNDKFKYYGGLAVEHEFAGRAAGTVEGIAIRGADISGTSVRGEIGATFRPGEKSNVTLDLNLSGFAGKKQGFTGGLSAVFHI